MVTEARCLLQLRKRMGFHTRSIRIAVRTTLRPIVIQCGWGPSPPQPMEALHPPQCCNIWLGRLPPEQWQSATTFTAAVFATCVLSVCL